MIVLLLAAAVGAESPVTIEARAIPDTTTIGSHVRFEVEIDADADSEIVLAQPTERIGAFDIVDFGEEPATERDGRRIVTRWFTLAGFDVGHHLVTTPPVAYRTPGGELQEAPPVETRISIESLVGDVAAAELRDIAPPEPIPRDWTMPALLAVLAAALLAPAAGVWWWWRRRPAKAGPPPVPPDVRAQQALAALATRRLVEHGEVKEYYAELSSIVRVYLEERFGVRAPEMTTEEFLIATARGATLEARHRSSLGTFLHESDLVKFARHHPAVSDAERALEAARRFVAETRERAPEAA